MQDTSDQSFKPTHHDGYRLQVAPSPHHIQAFVDGQAIADSSKVLVMRETRYAPVLYFPREHIAQEHLIRTNHRTHCPFKGNASYWSIKIDGKLIENAAWSYETPFDEAKAIKEHIAFYWDKIDEWFEDGQVLERPAISGPTPVNPLVPWLLKRAWQSKSVSELLKALATTLHDNGFPLWRARLLIQTLNPLLFARGYTWQRGIDGIAEFQATHVGIENSQYQDSPFAAIINGEGGIRRRLKGEDARLDFPVLHELAAEGATDYIAVPMRFSDGQINILTIVSDQPDGFSTEQLGHLYEILANLSVLLESHAQRTSSKALLQTYLGQNAGRMVMDGLVKRGDAKELDAVIWFSDLRDSTQLIETLSKEEYLAALNDYYDCIAGAVLDNGGDVLKFIGDAILAVFPIEEQVSPSSTAYDLALKAVEDAESRTMVINTERTARNAPVLRFGTALHCDTVTFGNVGSPGRLDFTVIGSGVNLTARIASLCRDLDKTVLVSDMVASKASTQMSSIGAHELRGFSEPQELFEPI